MEICVFGSIAIADVSDEYGPFFETPLACVQHFVECLKLGDIKGCLDTFDSDIRANNLVMREILFMDAFGYQKMKSEGMTVVMNSESELPSEYSEMYRIQYEHVTLKKMELYTCPRGLEKQQWDITAVRGIKLK